MNSFDLSWAERIDSLLLTNYWTEGVNTWNLIRSNLGSTWMNLDQQFFVQDNWDMVILTLDGQMLNFEFLARFPSWKNPYITSELIVIDKTHNWMQTFMRHWKCRLHKNSIENVLILTFQAIFCSFAATFLSGRIRTR